MIISKEDPIHDQYEEGFACGGSECDCCRSLRRVLVVVAGRSDSGAHMQFCKAF